MKKKTIAIFTGYYLPHLGGVERYVSKLSEELVKKGYRIVIITSRHAELENKETSGNVTIYRLPIRNIFKSRYPIPAINNEYREVMNEISKEPIDYFILNTRFHLTSMIGARMARRRNISPIVIEHGTAHFTVGSAFLDFFGKIYEHLLTILLKTYAKDYYGVSKKCNEWLHHYGINAKGVLYNSVDSEDGKNVKDYYKDQYAKGEVLISYAGRLIKEKGILNLLAAFEQVKRRNPSLKLRLAIAGDGPLLSEIETKWGNDASVSLLGRLDFEHVKALYKRTDIFVYPSLYPEGLPTSILEAALLDCAIVATPRGGTEEVIIDEGYGIISDGSVEDLTRSLEKLAKDDRLREECSQRVKERVETVFNWQSVAEIIDKQVNVGHTKK